MMISLGNNLTVSHHVFDLISNMGFVAFCIGKSQHACLGMLASKIIKNLMG